MPTSSEDAAAQARRLAIAARSKARQAVRRFTGPGPDEPKPVRITVPAADEARRSDPYRLAVVAAFKDESRTLEEWIEFHRLVGVDKFVLVENDSSDDWRDIVQPYVDEGLVTLFRHQGRFKWPNLYTTCMQAYRGLARWIAFLDLDEFLHGVEEDSLPALLADYEHEAGLAVNWLMFNASGHVLRPDGLVIENYTWCQVGGNKHVKLVVDPERCVAFTGGHTADFAGGATAVDEQHRPVTSHIVKPPSIDRIRINHYWTKSVEDYFGKLARGYNVPLPAGERRIADLLHSERNYGTGEDRTIQRFLPALKARMDAANSTVPESSPDGHPGV